MCQRKNLHFLPSVKVFQHSYMHTGEGFLFYIHDKVNHKTFPVNQGLSFAIAT